MQVCHAALLSKTSTWCYSWFFCLAAALSTEEYLSATSADPLANQARKASFFSLVAPLLLVSICGSLGCCPNRQLLATALDHHFHNGCLEHGPFWLFCRGWLKIWQTGCTTRSPESISRHWCRTSHLWQLKRRTDVNPVQLALEGSSLASVW